MNGWRKVLLAAILTAAEGTAALGQQVDSLLIVEGSFSFEGAGIFSLEGFHATSAVEKASWGTVMSSGRR